MIEKMSHPFPARVGVGHRLGRLLDSLPIIVRYPIAFLVIIYFTIVIVFDSIAWIIWVTVLKFLSIKYRTLRKIEYFPAWKSK